MADAFAMLETYRQLVQDVGACALPGVNVKYDSFMHCMWGAQRAGYVRRWAAEFVAEGLRYGFRLGVDTGGFQGQRVFQNYPSAVESRVAVARATRARVAGGKTLCLGAWTPELYAALRLRYPAFRVFPMGAVPKPLEPSEARPISDHSRSGLNDLTDVAWFKHALDACSEVAQWLQRGYVMAVTDVEGAFPMLPLHPSLWPFFFFRFFESDATDVLSLYVHLTGDFGAAGLPGTFKIFFADVLVPMARFAGRLTLPMAVYVDDLALIGPSSAVVNEDMARFQRWAEVVCGVVFKVLKDRAATTLQLYLGLWWDSLTYTRTLEERKLVSYLALLDEYSRAASLSLRERRSVAGRMQRAVLTLPPGASCLLASVFAMMAGLTYAASRRRTTRAERQDYALFRRLLSLNMGRGFYRLDDFRDGRAEVFTDASKSREFTGGGYVTRGAVNCFDWWRYGGRTARNPIMVLEGHTAYQCASDCGYLWRGLRVVYHVDNTSFQQSAKKGWSRAVVLNDICKRFFVLQVRHSFIVDWRWISTHDNVWADHLSRNREDAFMHSVEALGCWAPGSTLSHYRHRHPKAGRTITFDALDVDPEDYRPGAAWSPVVDGVYGPAAATPDTELPWGSATEVLVSQSPPLGGRGPAVSLRACGGEPRPKGFAVSPDVMASVIDRSSGASLTGERSREPVLSGEADALGGSPVPGPECAVVPVPGDRPVRGHLNTAREVASRDPTKIHAAPPPTECPASSASCRQGENRKPVITTRSSGVGPRDAPVAFGHGARRAGGVPGGAVTRAVFLCSMLLGLCVPAEAAPPACGQGFSVPYSRSLLYDGLPAEWVPRLQQIMDVRLMPSSMRTVRAGMRAWRHVAATYGWPVVIETDEPQRAARLATFVLVMSTDESWAYSTIQAYVWGVRQWNMLQGQLDPVLGVANWQLFMQAIQVLTHVRSEPRRELPMNVLRLVLDDTDLSSFEEVQFVFFLLVLFFTFSRSESPCPKVFSGFDSAQHWQVRDIVWRRVVDRVRSAYALAVRFKAVKQDPRLVRPAAQGDGDWCYVGDAPDTVFSVLLWFQRLSEFYPHGRDPDDPFFMSRDRSRPYTYTCAMSDLRSRLARVGVDGYLYGLHGLRVAGYNSSLHVNGEELTVLQGGWSSAKSASRYHRWSVPADVVPMAAATVTAFVEGEQPEGDVDDGVDASAPPEGAQERPLNARQSAARPSRGGQRASTAATAIGGSAPLAPDVSAAASATPADRVAGTQGSVTLPPGFTRVFRTHDWLVRPYSIVLSPAGLVYPSAAKAWAAWRASNPLPRSNSDPGLELAEGSSAAAAVPRARPQASVASSSVSSRPAGVAARAPGGTSAAERQRPLRRAEPRADRTTGSGPVVAAPRVPPAPVVAAPRAPPQPAGVRASPRCAGRGAEAAPAAGARSSASASGSVGRSAASAAGARSSASTSGLLLWQGLHAASGSAGPPARPAGSPAGGSGPSL